MNQKTKTFLKSLMTVLVFAASLTAVAVWTEPGNVAPGDNPQPPLNASANSQMKIGPTIFGNGLRSVGLFIANGNSQFDGNVNINGSMTVGAVDGRTVGGPSNSAILSLNSTTQGFLPPSMTMAQRNAIASPATGLLIFQTNNLPGFYYFNGVAWVQLAPLSDPKPLP